MLRYLETLVLLAAIGLTTFQNALGDPPAATIPANAQAAPAPQDDVSQEDAPSKKDGDESDKSDVPKHKYIRIARDDDEKPLALQTSVITFTPAGEKHQGVTIELVGAVHVGDADYYGQLNKIFESYDVLLYELVAPEGTLVPKRVGKESGSAIGLLQGGMSSLLELEHQLEQIDYTKDNFVHADMTPEEFAKSMSDRGEGFLQMFFRAMGQGAAMQGAAKQPVSETDLLFAMFAQDRSTKLKRLLARQFEDMETSMAIFDGPDGSTIITERNKKCFEVLTKELENGHKRIGVFYGASHLADMEKRLVEEFHMQRAGEKWIVAWDLQARPAAKETDKPKAVEPQRPDASDQREDDRDPFDES